MLDADGDGVSNAIELGDPECLWRVEDDPITPVSDASDATDQPENMDNQGGEIEEVVGGAEVEGDTQDEEEQDEDRGARARRAADRAAEQARRAWPPEEVSLAHVGEKFMHKGARFYICRENETCVAVAKVHALQPRALVLELGREPSARMMTGVPGGLSST